MLIDFIKYIEENHLVKKGDRVLMAVSGGIDSMVMADLFIKYGIKTGIAHCNFCLRGRESDKDEELVRKFASNNNIPFFSTRFKTKEYAAERGISIQMAARELRYKWFEEIRKKNKFVSTAIAHNLNDNIETLLINLTRGTGIAGLTGIRVSGDSIIRPLLFASRESIEKYCKSHKIKYREDKSNSETKYARNKIRHLVIPVLKEINPSIETTLNQTAERMREVNEIYTCYIDNLRKKSFEKREEIVVLNPHLIQPFFHNKTILFELFRPYGVTNSNLDDLLNVITGKTGGQLFTLTHRIIKNRKEIIISGHSQNENENIRINNAAELNLAPGIESAKIINITSSYVIPNDCNFGCFDSQKISFPLIIRKWRHGDFFYPFGMNQKKKLSDYFVDRKFSRLEKEKARILESGGKIVWIIGERIDNRVRITRSTKKVLAIEAQRYQGTKA
ncbi:MAG: tRNA lysidine(34) synthetase TilS [Bacteroidia bacterium]|nr:tRNA lysidine(34) synthetase TilS [Bacteroidia bacterium]